MSPDRLKEDLGGLPAGEIRELILKGDIAVSAEARKGRARIAREMRAEMEKNGERIGKVEIELAGVKSDVASVKKDVGAVKGDVAAVKVDVASVKALAEQAVEQNKQILAAFEKLQGEVEEVTEETADGLKVVTKVKTWGQTAKDFHLLKWVKIGVAFLGSSLLFRGIGFLFGNEVRDKLIHIFFAR